MLSEPLKNNPQTIAAWDAARLQLITQFTGAAPVSGELSKNRLTARLRRSEQINRWARHSQLRGAPPNGRTRMSERRRSSRCLRGRLYFYRNGRKSQRCLILDAFYEGARMVMTEYPAAPGKGVFI